MRVLKLLFVVFISISLIGCSLHSKEETLKGVNKEKRENPQEKYFPTKAWRTSTPEEQGMDSTKLAELFTKLNETYPTVNSTVIARNGYIVAERYRNGYNSEIKQIIFSATKSILSALVGIASDQGFINAKEKVIDIFPNRDIQFLDERKKKITVEHLLMMREGFEQVEHRTYGELLASDDPVQYVLDLPMREEPGQSLNYSSSNSHLLSAILQEKTGMPTTEFAEKYLFEPLGIENYYFHELHGVARAGNGLIMTPHDIAKIGQLYLNGGEWEGKQIISKEWIKTSTTSLYDDKMVRSRYGYHWYVDEFNKQPLYYALGSFGQYLIVLPELDIVAVFTAGMESPQGFESLLDLVEPYIISSAASEKPLEDNPMGYEAMKDAALKDVGTVHNHNKIPMESADKINKKVFSLSANAFDYKNLSVDFEKDKAVLKVVYNGGEAETYEIGFSEALVNRIEDRHFSVMGTWEDPKTLKINFELLETFGKYSWTLKFDKNFQSFKLKELSEDGEETIMGKRSN